MPAPTTRRMLLASTALATVVLASTVPAAAFDATWLPAPATGDFNTASNWNIGIVPDGVAYFGASSITNVTLVPTFGQQLGGITINAGSYNFTIDNTSVGELWIGGAGVTVNGGGATITNTAGGATYFLNSSTAGNATYTINGVLYFADSATAGTATISSYGGVTFDSSSTAGSAQITNYAGSLTRFIANSSAGSATLINNAGATVDFSGSAGPAGDGRLSAGSIAGAGSYILGANQLTVGGNNASTEVSGVISGAGGSLVKTGSGTLTLTGANTYTGGTTISDGTLQIGNGGTSGSITSNVVNDAALIFNRSDAVTFSDAISGSGTVEKKGGDTLTLTGANTYTGGTTISAGTLQLGTAGGAASILGQVTVGAAGTLDVVNATMAGIANAGNTSFRAVSSAGQAAIANTGTVTFTDASSAGVASINNGAGATVNFRAASSASNANIDSSGTVIFTDGSSAGNATLTNRGTLSFLQGTSSGAATITNAAGATLTYSQGGSAANASITNSGNVAFTDNASGGNAAITNMTGGLVDFKDSAGPANDGKLSAGSIAGGGEYLFSFVELTVGGNNRSTEVSGELSGIGGALVKTGTGALTLSGTSSYTGATKVNGGTLAVNGSIAASTGVTVNTGATLGGTGQLPGVTVNAGGNLAPGNSIGTITINGDLQFGAGSFYTVEVSPTAADRTNVTGTATLTGATVRTVALPGSFRGQTFTILSADGGLGGTRFDGLTIDGSFSPARNPHLTYDTSNVFLVLDPGTLMLAAGATRNQVNVAGGINRAVEAGAAPPAGFDTLLNISAAAAGRALDQLSGESSTQGQSGAFQLGGSYLTLLSDAFGTNRGESPVPLGYASERTVAPSAVRSAFAAVDKVAPAAYTPRWDVWGTAFGGGNNLAGDPARTGSRDASTRAGAVAAGADYRLAPGSLVGFSLAGGAMNWSVNGSGSSDVFMAGVYGKHTIGPAYVSAAASYANYWMSTTRTVTVAGIDQLRASFNATGFGGRIEGGTRLPARFLDVSWTPYGAIQGQSFRTPDYTEAAVTGSNQFALSFAGRTATAFRAEIGMHAERLIGIADGSQLSLFGRTAYAHDTVSNPALAATFTALGNTGGFTVFGAQPSQHLMLSSAGAEWRLAGGVSFMVKADGEWGERSRSYSGVGRFRYSW